MKTSFCVFVVLCLIHASMVSSLETTKSCAEFGITPMQDFAKDRYVGDWFIHQQYDVPGGDWFITQPYDFPGSTEFDCFVIIRTPRPDGNHNFTEILFKPGVLPEFRADGLATFNHPGEGSYMFSSEDIPQYNGEYVILKTDYTSYTIECKCTDLTGGGSEVEFYVLSRSHIVTSLTQKEIDEVIDDHHFDRNVIRTLNIASCPSEMKKESDNLTHLL